MKVTGEGHFHGNYRAKLEILHHCLEPLESVMKCVEMNWMAILVWKLNSEKYAKKIQIQQPFSQFTEL